MQKDLFHNLGIKKEKWNYYTDPFRDTEASKTEMMSRVGCRVDSGTLYRVQSQVALVAIGV